MIYLTRASEPGTMDNVPLHEVNCEYICIVNGKVERHVLHFLVSEEKFQEQYAANTADSGTS